MWCGPSSCIVLKQCHSPLLVENHGSPTKKRKGVLGPVGSSEVSPWSGQRSLKPQLLSVCRRLPVPPFLDCSKTPWAISTAMIASRLWEADYSQSYLTLLSDLENNTNICQCEFLVRHWAQNPSVRCGGVCLPAEQEEVGEQTVPTSSHWNLLHCQYIFGLLQSKYLPSSSELLNPLPPLELPTEDRPYFTRVWTKFHISWSNSLSVNASFCMTPSGWFQTGRAASSFISPMFLQLHSTNVSPAILS